jgi:outer membrane cobalamin receptor
MAAIGSLLGVSASAVASDFLGLSLEQALDELQARGLSILYSSDLVKPDMQVIREPSATTPRTILEEVVEPHGIRIMEGPSGTLLLTRATQVAGSAATAHAPSVTEVVVTASRYAWVRIPQPSLTRLSDVELHLAPNVGDDPFRTLARLPGAAATDLSAKYYVRGGAADETLVRFDGLRLANPFHLKDFQSIFSAIDPSLVGAIDVYTGGFPVNFGDRMSGVIDIHPVRAEAPHREISLSLYNASAMAAGRLDQGRSDWAIAARRGNLDRVLDWSGMQLGEPAYSDLYARFGRQLSGSASISGNLLQFDDDIELADSDLEEEARARYRDRYLWLRLDAHPRQSLSGATIVARAELESVRVGEARQPGISSGSLEDRREHAIEALQTDWSWQASDATVLQFGGEWRHSTGHYRYVDDAAFDVVLEVPGLESQAARANDIELRRTGDQYGAYTALRVEVAEPLTLEGGVRWDRSTLSDDGAQWSPRASVLYRLGDATSLRASWGRFAQTMAIDELPISDGVASFAPAQRAEHALVSMERRFDEDVELRVEAYAKRYSHVQPRYENLLNRLVILPELKPDRVRIRPTHARAVGLEASLRSVRSRPLFWWASYAWSRAEDELADGTFRRSWDQQHALNFGIGWEGARWELSLAGLARTGWPTTKVQLVSTEEAEILYAPAANTQRLQTYVDIDARIARKFSFRDGSTLTAFFEISNALDRRNECCVEYGLDDDFEETVLELEGVRSLPRLPSIGVIWRF